MHWVDVFAAYRVKMRKNPPIFDVQMYFFPRGGIAPPPESWRPSQTPPPQSWGEWGALLSTISPSMVSGGACLCVISCRRRSAHGQCQALDTSQMIVYMAFSTLVRYSWRVTLDFSWCMYTWQTNWLTVSCFSVCAMDRQTDRCWDGIGYSRSASVTCDPVWAWGDGGLL